MKLKAVFLDRDGTLIYDKVYLNDPQKIEYIPGVFEGLRLLRDAGFVFVMVTNQAGLAKGLVKIQNMDTIHRLMLEEFSRQGIDFKNVYYAPGPSDHDHEMRKPNAGMLRLASQHFNIDLNNSWMIGDRMSDVEAGRRAGTKTVLLTETGCEEFSEFAPPTIESFNLLSAAQKIVELI